MSAPDPRPDRFAADHPPATPPAGGRARPCGREWRGQGLVCPSTVSTPMEPRNLVRNYKAALQRAGLPEATRFHDLRHTAASLLVAQGVHPRVVTEILGHSQIALTMNTYAHVISESQREALAHMDHFFPETRETGD